MICSSAQSMLSANTCVFSSHRSTRSWYHRKLDQNSTIFRIRDSSSSSSSNTAEDDCNEEECAPDKEVGTVSLEWLAGEKTKVVGTYPPRKKGWTGYVEKDTAGQTNIYSVEPAVYIAESAISSGTAGTSSEGAENTAAIAAGLAFISIAAVSSVSLQVAKNTPTVQNIQYSGPSLSYYINKFKPLETTEVSTAVQPETAPSVQSESSAPEVPQVQEEATASSIGSDT